MSSTTKKIAAMRTGGKKLAEIKEVLLGMVAPGVTLAQIEKRATELLHASGGEPAFMRVPGYSYSTCINVNEGIVHGIPDEYEIKDGDLVSIDVGLYYDGFYTDTSASVIAGTATKELEKIMQVGKQAMNDSIAQAVVGKRIGHISQAMEKAILQGGMHPMKSLTGHGVGSKLHEAPYVPCFLDRTVGQTPALFEGQTLAIEAIYTTGAPEMVTEDDGWTISTKDGKIAGLFEETVLVTGSGPEILTIL